jgi:uncharacterized protein YjbI with pentapeptide repeats
VPRVARSPSLPRHLERIELAELADGEQLAGCAITGELVGIDAARVEIVESHLTDVRCTGSDLSGILLRDAVLERCDLSGAVLEDARIERCVFTECRLSGTILASARLRHVTFRGCRMDTVSLRMAAGSAVRFEHCDLRGADLYAAELPGSQLLDCDLTGADVSGATLTGSELHGSQLEALEGVLAVRDVVIDPLQVTALAHAVLRAHGITISDEPARGRIEP